MIQVIPRWKVSVTRADGSSLTFWVHDVSMMAVCRKIADMQFTESALEHPASIVISGGEVIGLRGVAY